MTTTMSVPPGFDNVEDSLRLFNFVYNPSVPPPVSDLSSYVIFALVAQAGSMSAAAQKLGLGRSAVSQKLARLEATLGYPLFRRTTRRVVLSPAGGRLLPVALNLLRAYKEMETVPLERTPRLRVNASSNVLHAGLGEALWAYAKKASVALELTVANHQVDLLEAKFDLVVRVAKVVPGHGVGRKLLQSRLIVAAAPSYLAGYGRPRHPQELSSHVCLHYERLPLAREWAFSHGKQSPPVPVGLVPSVTSDDGETLLHLARSGVGLVVVPQFLVHEDLAARRLAAVLEEFMLEEIHVWGLLPEGRNARAPAKEALAAIAKFFKRPT